MRTARRGITLLSVVILIAAWIALPPPSSTLQGKARGDLDELRPSNPDAPSASVGRLPRSVVEVVRRPLPGGAGKAKTTPMGFTPPSPFNETGADNWEPDIVADDAGNVYMVFSHYDLTSTASVNEAGAYIQVSRDGGATFSSPQLVGTRPYPDSETPGDFYDPVVAFDPGNPGHVYVAFMAYGGTIPAGGFQIYVAKSTNYGSTFPQVVRASEWNGGSATGKCKACDHEWLAALNGTVYAMYGENDNRFMSISTNGGVTWTEDPAGALPSGAAPWPVGSLPAGSSADVIAFAEDAVIDSSGNVWTAWASCTWTPCNVATGEGGHFLISKTTAGTTTTTSATVAAYKSGFPNCPFASCGYEYFAAQNDIAIDAAGNFYMVYMTNPANTDLGPPRIGLSKCSTSCEVAGNWTHVANIDDKAASGCAGSPPGCYAMFPRIDAGEDGEIVVMWMDDRRGNPINHTNGWNTWWRSSLDGGVTWEGRSHRLSRYKRQFPLVSEEHGFRFPFGDYMDVAISPGSGAGLYDCTKSVAFTWGEGRSWDGSYDTPPASGVVYVTVRCLD